VHPRFLIRGDYDACNCSISLIPCVGRFPFTGCLILRDITPNLPVYAIAGSLKRAHESKRNNKTTTNYTSLKLEFKLRILLLNLSIDLQLFICMFCYRVVQLKQGLFNVLGFSRTWCANNYVYREPLPRRLPEIIGVNLKP
jgi:hypothetical protein